MMRSASSILKFVAHVGTLMPAFAQENGGTLTRAQIQVLVNQIKGIPYKTVEKQEGDVAQKEVIRDPSGIAPMWGMPPKPPRGVPSYRATSSSTGGGAGDVKKGDVVFARACAVCHGDHGQGIGEGSETDRTINEPVQFYTSKARQPYELVVNSVGKDLIVGYLATPKEQATR